MSVSKSIPKLSTYYDYACILYSIFLKGLPTPFLMVVHALKEIKCSYFDMKQTL